jgi:hypothetical protein
MLASRAHLILFAICFFGGIATAVLGLAGLIITLVVAIAAPFVFVVRRST